MLKVIKLEVNIMNIGEDYQKLPKVRQVNLLSRINPEKAETQPQQRH